MIDFWTTTFPWVAPMLIGALVGVIYQWRRRTNTAWCVFAWASLVVVSVSGLAHWLAVERLILEGANLVVLRHVARFPWRWAAFCAAALMMVHGTVSWRGGSGTKQEARKLGLHIGVFVVALTVGWQSSVMAFDAAFGAAQDMLPETGVPRRLSRKGEGLRWASLPSGTNIVRIGMGTWTDNRGYGRDRVCVATASKGVWCFSAERVNAEPRQVAVERVDHLAVGNDLGCGLLTSGELRCWGKSDLLKGLPTSGVVAIDMIGHRWCVSADGSLRCGSEGQVVNLPNADPPTQIALTHDATCFVSTADSVGCFVWAGDNHFPEHTLALPVGRLSGGKRPCMLAGGSLQCWAAAQPVQMESMALPNIVDASKGWDHRCATTEEGGALCWGDNEWGQVGNAMVREPRRAQSVDGLGTVVGVATGYGTSCAATADGRVACWGREQRERASR